MLQRCRIVGKSSNYNISNHLYSCPNPRPISGSEWKPFDLVQKSSGLHNLSRTGYDEEKCRNVLVRFCAHVPRNYQYKDGIQQVFLILREHLGDENLDLAGGVLYELIEVDCEHSDDPGAAFQRWRHDHMYRYADFELPHIPHMTTITSSIIPTQKLSLWRSDHPERYRFVLSDSSTPARQIIVDPSCIRSKKAWLIDHTLFVTTQLEGTRPMRSPNPKEFHEMQWDTEYGGKGRFVEQRELPVVPGRQPSEAALPGDASTPKVQSSRSQKLRRSLSSISIIEKITDKMSRQKKEPKTEQKRRSWMPSPFTFETGTLFKDRRSIHDTDSVPFPEGMEIPNAIFARKFLLVDQSENLPSALSIPQMPTAESKATDTVIQAAATGLIYQAPPWLFRGPFTPQLGFDGGLDFDWTLQDAEVTMRRFDLDTFTPEISETSPNHAAKIPVPVKSEERNMRPQSPSKRGGRVFETQDAGKLNAHRSDCLTLNGQNQHTMETYSTPDPPILPPYTPDRPGRPQRPTNIAIDALGTSTSEM
ncbi:hypothetical protein F5Y18DRAFT_106956 [Xylariaceae sp. FL1019]|nr:hypothetical protein F5Y18DRAFT_106956 [Xylariaceae sp. FL1019]